MADFPRTVVPTSSTLPEWPGPRLSIGDSGKLTSGSPLRFGRTWSETYPIVDFADQVARAWAANVLRLWHQGIAFDIVHPILSLNAGLFTPLAVPGDIQVNGANQTGETLLVKGAAHSVALWARAGDIIRIPGLLTRLVFDVTADANSSAGGLVSLKVSPFIPTAANSPPDSTAIIVSSVKFRAMLIEKPNIPQTESSRFAGVHLVQGVTLRFREAF